MSSPRRALLAWRAFPCQPPGREFNRGPLWQQYALRGADRACFHQARRFKGSANLGKLISIQLDILIRFPLPQAMFQDRAALAHKLRMGDTIFGKVQRGATLVADAKQEHRAVQIVETGQR
jgi:hypothetical protein